MPVCPPALYCSSAIVDMLYRIDVKLFEFLKMSISRLKDDDFLICGFVPEPDLTVIVSGWFDSAEIELPFSDAIRRLGRIVYGNQGDSSTNSDVIGHTDHGSIHRSEDPIEFRHENPRIEIINLSYLMRDQFCCIYLRDSHNDVLRIRTRNGNTRFEYPMAEEDSATLSDLTSAGSVYVDSMVDTAVLLYTPDSLDISTTPDDDNNVVVGIFAKTSSLPKSINSLIGYGRASSSGSRKICVNYQYFIHPVLGTAAHPISGSPIISDFSLSLNTLNLIRDPHHLIPLTEQPAGVVCQDGYSYYHYNVDGTSDSGWGCAYRSIQTLMSWFVNNHNIADSVLSIPVIQALLRRVDYAHADLVAGSKKWIGCIEAATVLREASDDRISARILHAGNVAELTALFNEAVKQHLLVSGSPVMVGAGNYAYVVVGIATDAALVVDPHYCVDGPGCPDARKAVGRGWIGWKRIDTFFDFKKINGNFINICLPFIERS